MSQNFASKLCELKVQAIAQEQQNASPTKSGPM